MASSSPVRVGIATMAIFSLLPMATAFNLWKSQDMTDSTSLQLKAPIFHHSEPKITISLPQRLEEAKHIIKTFNSMPSCPKIATAALMHSCSSPHESTESGTDHASHTSEALKAYGARLAVCELLEATGANGLVPKDCRAFVPTHRTTQKQTMAGSVTDEGYSEPAVLYHGYDELTTENLDRCVNGLAQEPQSWSSYSNSKQNAVVICNSVQAELQMEQSVKTYEKIIDSLGGIIEHHEQTTEAYKAQLSEVRIAAKDFISHLHNHWISIYSALNADVSDLTGTVREQLLRILTAASDVTQSSLQNMKQTTTDLEDGITAIAERAVHASNQVEYAGQYIEQHVIQQLGKVFHELGLQHGLVQSNNHGFNQLAAGLVEAVSQVNRTNDQLATTEIFAQSLHHQLQQASQDVEKFNQNVGYLANFVSFGWSAAIGKLSLFFASATVVTPLTFGFWEHWFSLSFLGNCGAALSTGLACGMASAYYFDPTNFFHEYSSDVFEDEFSARKHVLAGLLVGIIGTLCIVMLHGACCRYLVKKSNDPASPLNAGIEAKVERHWAV